MNDKNRPVATIACDKTILQTLEPQKRLTVCTDSAQMLGGGDTAAEQVWGNSPIDMKGLAKLVVTKA